MDSNAASLLHSLSNNECADHDLEDDIPTLQGTLEMLSLSEYINTFENERMDMESLVYSIQF